MSASLGGNQRVNLIDNDRVHSAQGFGGLRGEQQVERLRGGDQDLGGITRKAGTFALRRVAGAHTDGGLAKFDAHAPRHVAHADQGRAEVALHIHGESFQRRDVNDPAAFFLAWRRGLQHQAIKTPEKGGKRLAGSGGRQDQRTLAACNRRPAHALGSGGRVEDGAEPCRRDRMKAGEGVGGFLRDGRRQHVS